MVGAADGASGRCGRRGELLLPPAAAVGRGGRCAAAGQAGSEARCCYSPVRLCAAEAARLLRAGRQRGALLAQLDAAHDALRLQDAARSGEKKLLLQPAAAVGRGGR